MTFIKYLCVTSALLISFTSIASLDIEPGRWKVQMKIRTEGQTIDPGKEIKKAMKDLSSEEQVQLQQALEEVAGLDEKGQIEVCYDAEHFKQTDSTTVFNDEECISKVTKRTGSRIISDFICVDGTSGETTWIIHNKKKYTGIVKVKSGQGDESELIYRGKYIAPICEDLDKVVI
jgi:hypothetical protein